MKTAVGKQLAVKYNVKYIETSPGETFIWGPTFCLKTGINHNIDELLVGIVTQIRLKQAGKEGERRSRVDKVRFVLENLLRQGEKCSVGQSCN